MDSNIGGDGLEDLALDEREAETEHWKITGMNGYAVAVKPLRVCFKDLPGILMDAHFTGWLVHMVSGIYSFERKEGGRTRSCE